MKGIAMTVATLGIIYATAAVPVSASNARQLSLTPVITYSVQDQSNAQQPQAKTFTGTINKSGDQFILRDDAGNISYQLDDQQSAGKYEGKKVKVMGTLDQANNVIRVQSIEEAAA
jgi:uncharacterized protein YdeI (BOF family)